MFNVNPQTQKKLARFRKIKLGYYSFIALSLDAGIARGCGAAGQQPRPGGAVRRTPCTSRPIRTFIPAPTSAWITRTRPTIAISRRILNDTDSANWVLMPVVPYNPYENDATDAIMRPEAPKFATRQHYLGTDTTSRDILARLVYGTRTALLFAFAFMASVYLIGIMIGCAMGYFGGLFDLGFQRIIEIWSNIPFLYMVIIVFSVIPCRGLDPSAHQPFATGHGPL